MRYAFSGLGVTLETLTPDFNVMRCAPVGLVSTLENAYLSCVKRPDLLTT